MYKQKTSIIQLRNAAMEREEVEAASVVEEEEDNDNDDDDDDDGNKLAYLCRGYTSFPQQKYPARTHGCTFCL